MEYSKDHDKGWYSRGYLPHFDQAGIVQGITFRLFDSMPADALEQMRSEAELEKDSAKRAKVEAYLNAGYGACFLCIPAVAKIVEDALLHFDGQRYHLLAWVIMPNHVHLLVEQREGYPLGQVVHSWKSFTAHKANNLLQRSRDFWFRDFYDRFIRNREHLARSIDYIHYNPVVAGFVEKPEDWQFSSARRWIE